MKVSIYTLGCKVNFAEMSRLSDRLAEAGFDVAAEQDRPDVCVINSCTVTAQADRKVRTLVHGLRRRHPSAHLVLTGCHVDNPNPRVSAVPAADAVFPNSRKQEIFDYLVASFCPRGGTAQGSAFGRARYFLKVQDGCSHRCTYCIVWKARGRSRSEGEDSLVEEAREAVLRGHREVVLTGVDLGAYGRESGSSLAQLVRRVLEAIPPARLRLSSVNANDFTPDLLEALSRTGVCRHLHIPLQSGSDRVLKRMGRLYRGNDYLDLVEALRSRMGELALTTDVIVGFPGESEEDFKATEELASRAGFSGMHVFRYSPRAGTAAPRLGLPVDDPTSRERSHRLMEQAESQKRGYESSFVGRELEVIWDRRLGSRLRGLSDNYITVYAPQSAGAPGQVSRVRPVAAATDGLLCA